MQTIRHPLFAIRQLLLLAGDRLGRSLARARVGMGALTAHRQSAAMTKAAIAAEIHQTLDVHAGLATQVAFDQIVAVDHFQNSRRYGFVQLIDAAVIRNLHLLQDVGRILLAYSLAVPERWQDALF